MPADALRSFTEAIRAAATGGKRLRIRGGGTKDFYGQALEGEILDTRAYAGVVAYDPTELVITVRGGTPLAEVERVLAEKRQMLAFEPPHFAQLDRVRRRSAAPSPRGSPVPGARRRARCATSCSACG